MSPEKTSVTPKVLLAVLLGFFFLLGGAGPSSADAPFLGNVDVINNDVGGSGQVDASSAMSLAPDGTLYAAWTDYRSTLSYGRFSWTSDGTSWGDGIRNDNDWIITADTEVDLPYLVLSNGVLYMAYSRPSGMYTPSYAAFTKSTDYGRTWTTPVTRQYGMQNSLAVAPDGTIWMAGHTCEPDCTIKLWQSTDGGASFSEIWQGGPNYVYPIVKVDAAGTLYMTYSAAAMGFVTDVFVNRRTATGVDWDFDPAVRVNSVTTGTQIWAHLSLSFGDPADGRLFVVWFDERLAGDYDIYFSRSDDAGATWTTEVRVDDGPFGMDGWMPWIAVGPDDVIHVVWDDRRAGDMRPRYAQSTDGGLSFSASIPLSPDAASSQSRPNPKIAVAADGTLHVIWHDERVGSDGDIFHARSTDGGRSFLPNTHVCDELGISKQAAPTVALDGSGTVHVVWKDERAVGGTSDLFYSLSTDGGITFTPNQLFESGPAGVTQDAPDAAAEGSNVYVTWTDSREDPADPNVYLKRSLDGGATFLPVTRVNNDTVAYNQRDPAVACDVGGLVYVAFFDDRDGHAAARNTIYVARSTDYGAIFDLNVCASGTTWDLYMNPDIAVGPGGRVYVVWQSRENGWYRLYLARSDDTGASFTTPVLVSTRLAVQQENPAVAVGPDGAVYVAWQDDENSSPDVWVARSDNFGASFLPAVRANDVLAGLQREPGIIVKPDNTIQVVWTEGRDMTGRGLDVFFSQSADRGQTFQASIRMNDDTTTQNQSRPQIAVGSTGNIGIVFEDNRYNDMAGGLMNPEVFFTTLGVRANPEARNLTVDGWQDGTPQIVHLVNHQPLLAWMFFHPEPGEWQIGYEVEVWDGPGATGTRMWAAQGSSGTTVESYNRDSSGLPLIDATTYYFRVRVQDTFAAWSKWAEEAFHMNGGPGAPHCLQPLEGDLLDAGTAQTVVWEQGTADPEGDALTYSWEVATDPAFGAASIVASGATTGLASDVFTTLPDSHYFWRVNVTDWIETSPYSNDPPGYCSFDTKVVILPPVYYILRSTIPGPIVGRPPEIDVIFQAGLAQYLEWAFPATFTDPEAVLAPGMPALIFYGCDDPAYPAIAVTPNRAAQSVDISPK